MNDSVKSVFKSILAAGYYASGRMVLGLAVCAPAIALSNQTGMNAASLPLYFEAGRGQAGTITPFLAHGPNSEFLLTATNAQVVLHKSSGEIASACMQLVGASAAATVTGAGELAARANYFLGKNPAGWQSGIPTFSKVRVENVYPGINVVYYGNGSQLEYDFNLAAGVDPKAIALRFDGAKKISINPQGELVVAVNGGEIIQHRPVVYQIANGGRHQINGGYTLLDSHTAAFSIDDYDHQAPLVIDPVLGYSTYFSGNTGAIIEAVALSKDGSNSVFVAGQTLSSTFLNYSLHTTNVPGYQKTYKGGTYWGDVFVAKFDYTGTNPIYFTYLGGSSEDVPFGLTVDAAGNAFVTGFTESTDFPTTNAIYSHLTGQPFPQTSVYPADAFVTEINPGGTNLVYSTYIGGSEVDVGTAITVDTNDNAYVVGYTYSTDFPIRPGAYQPSLKCTNYTLYFNANAFLVEVAPNGVGPLKYSSYFGGNNYDEALAVTLGESNYIYVAGATASTNFPLVNPLANPGPLPDNTHLNGSSHAIIPTFDAFVAKFVPGFTNNYTNVVYSTYLGGSNFDMATGIAADGLGNAYVVGSTSSTNFPYTQANVASCLQTNTAGIVTVTNAFLTQIMMNNGLPVIGHSVLFGGVGNDVANGVTISTNGHLFVIGSASSTDFPVTPNNISGSLMPTNSASSPTTSSDAIIAAFNTNATLIYSAYLGGSGDDLGNGIAVDSAENAYVVGQTASPNFPALNASLTNYVGIYYDGFIAKILMTSASTLGARQTGTNVTVSWKPVGQDAVDSFELQSNTNLLATTNWTVIATNLPPSTNGIYNFVFPPTNSPQFFRMHLY